LPGGNWHRFRWRRRCNTGRRWWRRGRSEGDCSLGNGDFTGKSTTRGLLNIHAYTSTTNSSSAYRGINIKTRFFIKFFNVNNHITNIKVDQHIR
jgi:hypothetical protein